jgi:hypothetical protein
MRAYKAQQMREARADPIRGEIIRQRQLRRYRENGGYEKQKTYISELQTNHFFVWRSRLWRSHFKVEVTARELWSLWRKQRGRCVLSGRKLQRDAHLDHVVSIAQGGTHGLENIRWLDPQVNLARRELSDDDFATLCSEVIGRRILSAHQETT